MFANLTIQIGTVLSQSARETVGLGSAGSVLAKVSYKQLPGVFATVNQKVDPGPAISIMRIGEFCHLTLIGKLFDRLKATGESARVEFHL